MPRWRLLLLAGLLLACGPRKNEVELGMVEVSRFKRVGVLPFSDSHKKGRETAELVARGLFERGIDVAEVKQMELVFKTLKLEIGSGLSPSSLGDIRGRTYADALLFGSVDRRGRDVSVILIDTDLGEPVITAKLRPRRGRAFAGPEEIAREVVALIASQPRPAKGEALPELPAP